MAVLAWLILATAAAHADEALNLDQFRGKVVVVDFWASWCVPCRQSFPWLNAMQDKYADRGLVIIGVNVDRSRDDAKRFLSEVPSRFRILYNPSGSIAAAYKVPGMPSSYVFGPTGELIGQHIGFRTGMQQEREQELATLLKTTATAGAQ